MQQKYKFPYAFSGLIDTRNAQGFSNEHYPNVDMLYGMFSSKQDAWDTLSASNEYGVNALVVGRTVGVKVNGRIVEYWFEKDCKTIDDLVEKRVSVVDIPLEPADGEEFTDVEIRAIYAAIISAPKGSVFKGYNNSQQHYTLNVAETPFAINITYIADNTVQRMEINTDAMTMECSYITYTDLVNINYISYE